MTRTVFISGATSGIGEACARKFAENGYRIILNGRRAGRLERLRKQIQENYHTEAYNACFDVSNKEETQNCISNLPDEWKNIDLLINNAGLAAGKDPFDEAEIEDWELMIDTNIKGVLYLTRSLLPYIKKNQGHIINIGSIAGDVAYAGGSVYCASKAAIDILSNAMRIDLLQHKIKVTNIKPGAAETEFSLVRFKNDEVKANATYEGYTPLSAEDVANTVLYCASLPAHVCINELTLTCTAQANSFYTFKG